MEKHQSTNREDYGSNLSVALKLFFKTLYLFRFADQSAKIFWTNWSEIMKHIFGKNTYNEMKFLPG